MKTSFLDQFQISQLTFSMSSNFRSTLNAYDILQKDATESFTFYPNDRIYEHLIFDLVIVASRLFYTDARHHVCEPQDKVRVLHYFAVYYLDFLIFKFTRDEIMSQYVFYKEQYKVLVCKEVRCVLTSPSISNETVRSYQGEVQEELLSDNDLEIENPILIPENRLFQKLVILKVCFFIKYS